MVVLNLLSIPLKSGNLKGNKGYLEKGTWISHFVYLNISVGRPFIFKPGTKPLNESASNRQAVDVDREG